MTTFVLKEALKKVVGDPEFSDVILEARVDNTSDGGEIQEIHASKFVLSVRSEVFRKMLTENSFKEGQTNRVVCSGFNAATMKSLIHYLYTEDIFSFCNDRTPGLPEQAITPTLSKREMVDFQELTDLYNAGHFYDIQDLMEKIVKKAKTRCAIWKKKEMVPSLLYAACHVVDFETSSFLAFIQSRIRHHICHQTIELEMFKDNVGADHLKRVINGATTSKSKDKCYYWLNLLKAWASQSDEHVLAVQDAMKKISCKNLNALDLNTVYSEDESIMTDDVASEKFRTLALLSHKELDRVLNELKEYKKELSDSDFDIIVHTM